MGKSARLLAVIAAAGAVCVLSFCALFRESREENGKGKTVGNIKPEPAARIAAAKNNTQVVNETKQSVQDPQSTAGDAEPAGKTVGETTPTPSGDASSANAAAAMGETDAELLAMVREVKPQLEKILEKTFPQEVRAQVVTRDVALKLMEEEIDAELRPGELEATQKALIRFGMLPEGTDLRATFLELLRAQVAGFYAPRKKTLYLIHGVPLQKAIAAHEMTHAMQDQLFDLKKLTDARRDDEDRGRALQSLYEGEAVLSMSLFMGKYLTSGEVAKGMLQSSLAGMNGIPESVPLYLRETLLFPYTDGNKFVMRAFSRARGWDDLRNIYSRDIPESTEQILHPDKYYSRDKRDRPTTLDVSGTAAALGNGWEEKLENTHGEKGVQLLLRGLGLGAFRAVLAAQGWDGDRFSYLEKTENGAARGGLLWLSTWDGPGYAARFAEAYAEAIAKVRGETAPEAEGKRLWTGGGKPDILLCRWGTEVLLLDGFDAAERDRLRAYLTVAKKDGKLFAADNRGDAAAARN